MEVVGGGVLPRTFMEVKSVWVSSLEGGPRSVECLEERKRVCRKHLKGVCKSG